MAPFERLVLSALLLVCAVVCPAVACTIQGVDSGECKDPAELVGQMPFCAEMVNYRACVPKRQSAVPRWGNFTVGAKDKWVEEQFNEEWCVACLPANRSVTQ
jgi:hypothetical protein